MNTSIAILSLVQIVSGLVTGLAILWFTYRVFQLFAMRYLNMRAENNLAYSVFLASVLFSVGFSVSSVIQPLVSAFRLFSAESSDILEPLGLFIFYGGIYIGVSYLLSIMITVSGVLIYTSLTPLNEFEEIGKNNVGVSLVLSSIVVILNLMCKSGITLLIESLLPYPDLPPIG